MAKFKEWLEGLREEPNIKIGILVGYICVCAAIIGLPFFTNMKWWLSLIILSPVSVVFALILWWQMKLADKLEPIAMNAKMLWVAGEKIKEQRKKAERDEQIK